MKWLRTFLGLCVPSAKTCCFGFHEWEVLQSFKLMYAGLPRGLIYVQKCKKCGKLHNHEVDVGV